MKPSQAQPQQNFASKRREHLQIDIASSLSKVNLDRSNPIFQPKPPAKKQRNPAIAMLNSSIKEGGFKAEGSVSEESKGMSRNNSNSSFVEELEEVEVEIKAEQRLMIKICDGVYIGGQHSVWDSENMSVNYITHLIVLNSPTAQQGQNYVPSLVTYIHSVDHPLAHCQPSHILEMYKKISQFIQHAHDEGQSCLIVCRGLAEGGDGDGFACVYRPAALVAGYLMYKYRWAMLKALQFVGSRLAAGHKTADTLLRINQKLKPSTSQPHPAHSQPNIHSQLLTHLLPQLPHVNPQQRPQISSIPSQTLSVLEQRLQELGTLSYSWQKETEQREGRGQHWEQELVLHNTYLNCLSSEGGMTYCSALESNRHTKSTNSIPRPIASTGRGNENSRKSLKLQASQEKKQKERHSMDILKKCPSKGKMGVNGGRGRRVKWSNVLIRTVEEERKLTESCGEEPALLQEDLRQYKNSMRSIYNISESSLNPNESISSLTSRKKHYSLTSSTCPTPQPETLLPSLSKPSKNKITLNVIEIINGRSRQSERHPSRQTRELLSKKSKIYQSKGRLPTLQELLDGDKGRTKCRTLADMGIGNAGMGVTNSAEKLDLNGCLSQGNQKQPLLPQQQKQNKNISTNIPALQQQKPSLTKLKKLKQGEGFHSGTELQGQVEEDRERRKKYGR